MDFPFTVELQPPYSFWTGWLIAGLCLLAAAAFLWFFWFRRFFRSGRKDELMIHRPPGREVPGIRQRYLTELRSLEQSFREEKINVRQTYQELSRLIRSFVFEMTGIQAGQCTLSDIRKLRIPALTSLMQEYYVPEFADYDDSLRPESPDGTQREKPSPGNGDPADAARTRRISRKYVERSLQRTRKAIEVWR